MTQTTIKSRDKQRIKQLHHDLDIHRGALETPVSNISFLDTEEDLIEELNRINHIGLKLATLAAQILTELDAEGWES